MAVSLTVKILLVLANTIRPWQDTSNADTVERRGTRGIGEAPGHAHSIDSVEMGEARLPADARAPERLDAHVAWRDLHQTERRIPAHQAGALSDHSRVAVSEGGADRAGVARPQMSGSEAGVDGTERI